MFLDTANTQLDGFDAVLVEETGEATRVKWLAIEVIPGGLFQLKKSIKKGLRYEDGCTDPSRVLSMNAPIGAPLIQVTDGVWLIMKFSRGRIVVVPVLALLAGLFAATPALAVGSCSIVVPSRLTLNSPYELFTGRLGADCVESGEDWASWDIRHSYYGPSNSYFFDTGEVSNAWGFYDWEHLGTYYIEPSAAYDYDSNELAQNTLSVSVRLGSRLSLSSARSGKYVTLRSRATRYTPSAQGFRPWRNEAIVLSYRTCSTCAWRKFKTGYTNTDGKISHRFYAPKTKSYRAQTANISTTWGRTSATSRR